MRIQLFGACPCGARLDRSEQATEELGSLSLARLSERALDEARRASCQVCGSKATAGTIAVSYRMPGLGPFVVASLPCSDLDGMTLTLRKRLPQSADEGIIFHLDSSSELDAVRRLGSPLSVRGAWHEALLQIEMGFMERSFQAGTGLRLVASTDGSREHHLDLGRVPTFSSQLVQSYRKMLDDGAIYCFALIDIDASAEVIGQMAGHYGLIVARTGKEELAITRANGEFAVGLDIRELLVQAAVHCLTLPAAADPALAYVAARLVAAEETKLMIETSFGLDGQIEDGQLTFSNAQGKAGFDIDAYVEGTSEDREAMLTHLRMKLGIGL